MPAEGVAHIVPQEGQRLFHRVADRPAPPAPSTLRRVKLLKSGVAIRPVGAARSWLPLKVPCLRRFVPRSTWSKSAFCADIGRYRFCLIVASLSFEPDNTLRKQPEERAPDRDLPSLLFRQQERCPSRGVLPLFLTMRPPAPRQHNGACDRHMRRKRLVVDAPAPSARQAVARPAAALRRSKRASPRDRYLEGSPSP